MGMHHLHEEMVRGAVTEDEAVGRVYGWLPGVVTDIDTSNPKLMQIKARLGKMADNESTDWISQMGMGGMESLPEVGDPVGVIFVEGDPHRGAYFCFPQSNSKGRPTEPMVLGKTLVGMYNFLVTQFNQLRSDFNSFMSTYNGHTHGYNPGPSALAQTATTAAAGSSTSAAQANKGKASDGSIVGDNSSSAVALSKRGRIR